MPASDFGGRRRSAESSTATWVSGGGGGGWRASFPALRQLVSSGPLQHP